MLARWPQTIHKSRRLSRGDVSDYKNYCGARCEARTVRARYFWFLLPGPGPPLRAGNWIGTKIFGKPETRKDTHFVCTDCSNVDGATLVLIFIKSHSLFVKRPRLSTLLTSFTQFWQIIIIIWCLLAWLKCSKYVDGEMKKNQPWNMQGSVEEVFQLLTQIILENCKCSPMKLI